jgi:Domain of unknown function (DUF4352)
VSYPPPNPNQPQQPPVPPGYGPPPPGTPGVPFGPPPAKKNNKKLLFGIIGGVLALCCAGGAIAAIAGDDDDKPEASATTAGAAKDNAQAPKATGKAVPKPPTKQITKEPGATRDSGPGMGDPVRDGKFEFTVTKLDCSKSKVGSEYLNQKAQGIFCIISVTVKNIGKEAQTFDGSSQKAYDAEGTEFSNDTRAEIYANEGSPTFLVTG